MAGHSKWANIQHRKGRQDAKRGALFTRLIKEITVAARIGGPDVASNPRLRMAVEKASEGNMSKETVQRAIQRGAGGLEGANYEEVRYEGYGVAGAALIIDCMTDNRTRTVADVRHALTKFGGNLGTDGSVAYQFKHCGQFIFAPGTSEDKVMEAALEAGAEDVVTHDDGAVEVISGPHDFANVKDGLEKAGLKAEFAEVVMKPLNELVVTGEDAVRMQKILDALDSVDDMQQVYTNAVIVES
jgi:YebC/PmpR family DNA-binding regulatory protein